MQKSKLNRFIILSVAFHVILIAAVLLYFFKYPLPSGKPGTVMVGIIGGDDSSKNNSSESQESSEYEPKKRITKSEIAPDKKPIKQYISKQKETKQPKKKVAEKTSKSKKVSQQTTSAQSTQNQNPREGLKFDEVGQNGTNSKSQIQVAGTGIEIDSLAYPNYNINPKPKYPKVARKRGYEGEVKLKVFVLADGRVGKIEVLRPSGHKVLDESALDAVKDWVFVPGKQNGKEISSWVTVPITFQLKSS